MTLENRDKGLGEESEKRDTASLKDSATLARFGSVLVSKGASHSPALRAIRW